MATAKEAREGRFWQGDYNPHDRPGRRHLDQPPYHGALGYRDDVSGGYSPREFGDAPQWRSPPDWADPAVYRSRERVARPAHRGPRGYRRSDERIHEEVCERLAHAGHVDVSAVSVDVRDGIVILEGSVPERRMKHAIEDLIDSVHGVEDIDNRLRVPRGDARPGA